MRLIDADLLKKNIAKWVKDGDPQETEMVDLVNILGYVVAEIDEQPTAYDVDEVVKEVKEISMKWLGEVRTCNVIRAIRKGGVE